MQILAYWVGLTFLLPQVKNPFSLISLSLIQHFELGLGYKSAGCFYS